MKYNIFLLSLLGFLCIIFVQSKSQDYARHIELSLLFYECQRSGPLPSTNRIYWRHDSMVDAGKDVGLDLTGGYYDAGDNVKFNFPGASSMTILAWSGVEFADGYKKAGQWEYLLDAIKWGADYFIKCHPEKNVLYAQVGNGSTDHAWWFPPEYINYEYPSYKIDEENPGSEVAAETAAFLAAASMVFKEEDTVYSNLLLKHAIEIYDFADTYRGDYTKAVPAQGFYSSFNGYNDELAWGAAWLLRATGESKYLDKYNIIADATYSDYDPYRYTGSTFPLSWDDKRGCAYILIAQITKDEKRMKEAEDHCDGLLERGRTPGGLWYDSALSMWGSNRYASNAAASLAVYANFLPETDPKRKTYIDFVKSQMDYILGDNPAGVNFVVGAEENSPKSVHHRGASGTYGAEDNILPSFNIYTLYGALAGGPGSDDSYTDSRSNYQMNEVALDYNAAFTLDLAALVHFGYGVKDDVQTFDRAWPYKAPTPDITVNLNHTGVYVATGSGMMCSGWCVSFSTESKIDSIYHGKVVLQSQPNYIVCNEREFGFLDGEGHEQYVTFQINDAAGFKIPKEVEVLCDGYHPLGSAKVPAYKPEFGHSYKITLPGGPKNTAPLFEQSECWPSFIC